MTDPECQRAFTQLASRLAALSRKLRLSLCEGDLDQAERLLGERGVVIQALLDRGAPPQEVGRLLRDAHREGEAGIKAAESRLSKIHREIERLTTGRAGLNAYGSPEAAGLECDLRR